MSIVERQNAYFQQHDDHHHQIKSTIVTTTSTSMPTINKNLINHHHKNQNYNKNHKQEKLSTSTTTTTNNDQPQSFKKLLSPSNTTTTTTITTNSLNFIMNTFQCNINQEQAWALIYQSTKTLNELIKFERNEFNNNFNGNGNGKGKEKILLRKLTSFQQILFDNNGNVCDTTWIVSFNDDDDDCDVVDNGRTTKNVLSITNDDNNNDDDDEIFLLTKNDDKRLMNEYINCLIASLATIIYSALEWNWKNLSNDKDNDNSDDDEELDLEESLELLMLSMIRGSEHKDLVDEGYIDGMDESCLNWVLIKCEQHYQMLIQSDFKNATIEMLSTKNQLTADYYYQTICKMMIDEAVKLSKLFNQFYDQTTKFKQNSKQNCQLFLNSSSSTTTFNQQQIVDTENLKIWAQTWIKVMSELRFGVHLRPPSKIEIKQQQQQQRKNDDDLLRQIENIRENLRQAANNDNKSTSSLKSLPIMFTKESIVQKLKTLKSPSERKIKLLPINNTKCLHDLLMQEIKNFNKQKLRKTKTLIKPDIRKLYLNELINCNNRRNYHCKSLLNIQQYSINYNNDTSFKYKTTTTIKRKNYTPEKKHYSLQIKTNGSLTNGNCNNNLMIRPTLSLSHLLMNNSINNNNNNGDGKKFDNSNNKKKRLSLLKENNIHHEILIRNSTPKSSSSNTTNEKNENLILNPSLLCNSFESILVNNNNNSNKNNFDKLSSSTSSTSNCKNNNNSSLLNLKQIEHFSFIDDDDINNTIDNDIDTIDNNDNDDDIIDCYKIKRSSTINTNPLLRRSYIRRKSIINHNDNDIDDDDLMFIQQQPQNFLQRQKRCSSFSSLPKSLSSNTRTPITKTTQNNNTFDTTLGFRSLFIRKSPLRSSLSLVWSKIFGSPASVSNNVKETNSPPIINDDDDDFILSTIEDKLKQD